MIWFWLERGDTVAIVAPSRWWPSVYPHVFDYGCELLKSLWLKIKEMSHVRDSEESISRSPQNRADDINQAFADTDIKAIITAIGWDDSIRVIPYLDEELIRKNKKPLMGFSDTTALHLYLSSLGISCFYGPSIMAWISYTNALWKRSQQHLKTMLFSKEEKLSYQPYDSYTLWFQDRKDPSLVGQAKETHKNNWRKWLRGKGIIQWQLRWWCFELLTQLSGTPYRPKSEEWENRILFMELSGDYDPPIDSIIFSLRGFAAQWIFEKANGLLRWRPWKKLHEKKDKIDELLCDFIDHEVKKENFCFISQMDFGHTYPQIILPYGATVEIDCESKIIKLWK